MVFASKFVLPLIVEICNDYRARHDAGRHHLQLREVRMTRVVKHHLPVSGITCAVLPDWRRQDRAYLNLSGNCWDSAPASASATAYICDFMSIQVWASSTYCLSRS